MNLSDNFKKFMGIVEQNAHQLKEDLTWTPLPSMEQINAAAKKNGDKMKEEIKQKGAEMATDVLQTTSPVGALAGITKEAMRAIKVGDRVKDTTGRMGKVTAIKQLKEHDFTAWKNAMTELHDQAFQGYTSGQMSFAQSREIYDTLIEKNKDKLDLLYKNAPIGSFDPRPKVLWEGETRTKSVLDPNDIELHYGKPQQVEDFFGMHKSTELGDIVLTKSAKDPSKFQMTMFDGKLGSSNTVKDIQFNTKEEAMKAFEDLQ